CRRQRQLNLRAHARRETLLESFGTLGAYDVGPTCLLVPIAAARAQSIGNAEHLRMVHAQPKGAISAHGVPCDAATFGADDSAIVRVNIAHEIADDEVLPVARQHGIGVETAAKAVKAV